MAEETERAALHTRRAAFYGKVGGPSINRKEGGIHTDRSGRVGTEGFGNVGRFYSDCFDFLGGIENIKHHQLRKQMRYEEIVGGEMM